MARPQARAPRRSAESPAHPSIEQFRALVGVPSVALGLSLLILNRSDFADPALLGWVAAAALVEAFPVQTWGSANFTVTDPLWAALMILFPPPVCFVVAFVAVFDRREFHRDVTFRQAVFNRSQLALSLFVASLVFHSLADVNDPWTILVPAAVFAFSLFTLGNLLLVAVAVAIDSRIDLKRATGALLMHSPKEWVPRYLCFGLLGVVIAKAYSQEGVWVLALSALPLMVLGRGAMLQVRLAQEAVGLAQEREARFRAAAERASSERQDERMQLAAGLHDDAIPMFQGVNLLATTAEASIEDRDQLRAILGDIRAASDTGSGQLRKIVGSLRGSDIGDVLTAIRRLMREESRRHAEVRIDARIHDCHLPETARLPVYQILREALANALTHSQATQIDVHLFENDGLIRMAVTDNGHGFDEASLPADHYGIALMRERAATAGATLEIASSDSGAAIRLKLPSSGDDAAP